MVPYAAHHPASLPPYLLPPRSPEVWQSYGTFLRAIGKGPDALHAFENAIALGGKNTNYAELAMTLFTTGDVHAAEGIFGTFLQRSSNPRQIMRYTSFFDDREADALAIAGYERWLPLINLENRQCGLLAAKALMKAGGVIACEAPRHPLPSMHPASRAILIETARRLDAMVLRWGR